MGYILGGLIVLVLLVILFFSLRKTYQLKKEISNQCGQTYTDIKTQLSKEIEEERAKWIEENNRLTQQLLTLRQTVQDEINHQQESVEHYVDLYKKTQLDKVEYELNQLRDEKLRAYNEEFQTIIDSLETKRTLATIEVDNLTTQLFDLRAKYDTIIEGLRKQEELEKEKEFYRINLTDLDKEDIMELQAVSLRIHNREVISKLIWEVYYAKPYADLIQRVVKGKVCGIYCITNLTNKKSYIGKSTDIGNRWKEHIKSSLGIGTIAKSRFHTVLKEEGIDTFVWQILEVCDKDQYTAREHYWIDFFQTQLYGYNEKS